MIGSQRKRYRATVEEAARGVNPNVAVVDNYSGLDRFAIKLTGSIGTMKFTIAIVSVTFTWVIYNSLAPVLGFPQFDKLPALVIYLLGVNIFGTVLMPLLMVGQNMQSRHQEAMAEEDYNNNKKALMLLTTIAMSLSDDGSISVKEFDDIRSAIEEL